MTGKADTIRVSLDLEPELYRQLVSWCLTATPRAGYRTKIPTAVVARTCVQLLMTCEKLQDAVVEKLLTHEH